MFTLADSIWFRLFWTTATPSRRPHV